MNRLPTLPPNARVLCLLLLTCSLLGRAAGVIYHNGAPALAARLAQPNFWSLQMRQMSMDRPGEILCIKKLLTDWWIWDRYACSKSNPTSKLTQCMVSSHHTLRVPTTAITGHPMSSKLRCVYAYCPETMHSIM